jgi:hypothetical protein
MGSGRGLGRGSGNLNMEGGFAEGSWKPRGSHIKLLGGSLVKCPSSRGVTWRFSGKRARIFGYTLP